MGKAFRQLGQLAAWAVLTFIGLSWTWAGLSILTHNLAGSCEKIEFQPLGVGIRPTAGSCLANGDASSWGMPGGLVAVLIICGGAALILVGVEVLTRGRLPGLGGNDRKARRDVDFLAAVDPGQDLSRCPKCGLPVDFSMAPSAPVSRGLDERDGRRAYQIRMGRIEIHRCIQLRDGTWR